MRQNRAISQTIALETAKAIFQETETEAKNRKQEQTKREKLTEEQKKALNEREEALAEAKKTSRKRTKKEKDIIKTRITLEEKLKEQTPGTFSYMEWEGKIEKHKYASLTEEQRRELEGENKRLRLLTPPKSRKESVTRKKQILKLRALRAERGITESATKAKERKEEQEAIIEKQKAKEELDKIRKELGLESRETQKRKRSEEEEVRNARARLNLKRIRISMGLETPEDHSCM